MIANSASLVLFKHNRLIYFPADYLSWKRFILICVILHWQQASASFHARGCQMLNVLCVKCVLTLPSGLLRVYLHDNDVLQNCKCFPFHFWKVFLWTDGRVVETIPIYRFAKTSTNYFLCQASSWQCHFVKKLAHVWRLNTQYTCARCHFFHKVAFS